MGSITVVNIGIICSKKRNPTDINNDNINVSRILLYLQY